MPDRDPQVNALIEAHVVRATAPYANLVPPAVLEEMKKTLRFSLLTHPTAQALLRRLKAAPVVDESGKVAVDEAGAIARPSKTGSQ